MSGFAIALQRRLVLAAAAAAVVAGCSGQPPVAGGEGVTIARVERASWNALPEPGLFRITFDAARARNIQRRTQGVAAPEGLDPYTTELRMLDLEAERELKARGLCSGGAKLVTMLDEGDANSGITAIFKCRPPIF